MRPIRLTVVAAAALVLIVAAGCGSQTPPPSDSSSESGSSSTDLSPTEYDFDTSDVGDDLLGRIRQGITRPGAPAEVSVLVPDSYDGSLSLSPVESKADGVTYQLSLEFVPDKTPSEAGAGATSSGADTEVQSYDIDIDGRPFTVIVADGPSASSRIFLLGDGDSSYALQFDANVALSEVPDATVEEIHQAAASMEIEPS